MSEAPSSYSPPGPILLRAYPGSDPGPKVVLKKISIKSIGVKNDSSKRIFNAKREPPSIACSLVVIVINGGYININ